MCELIRNYGGRAHLPIGPVFAFLPLASWITQHGTALWPLFTFPGSLCIWLLLNPRKQRSSPPWLKRQCSTSLKHARHMKPTVLTVPWSPLCTKNIFSSEVTEWWRNAFVCRLKRFKLWFEEVSRERLLSAVIKCVTQRINSFYIPIM